MPIQDFIAKIAKGPRASKDLTWDESKQVMKLLIEGQATQAQIGAFHRVEAVALRLQIDLHQQHSGGDQQYHNRI